MVRFVLRIEPITSPLKSEWETCYITIVGVHNKWTNIVKMLIYISLFPHHFLTLFIYISRGKVLLYLSYYAIRKKYIFGILNLVYFVCFISLYLNIYTYICIIMLEVNSQTKYEFSIFIETLQIVSRMCSLQMSM